MVVMPKHCYLSSDCLVMIVVPATLGCQAGAKLPSESSEKGFNRGSGGLGHFPVALWRGPELEVLQNP